MVQPPEQVYPAVVEADSIEVASGSEGKLKVSVDHKAGPPVELVISHDQAEGLIEKLTRLLPRPPA